MHIHCKLYSRFTVLCFVLSGLVINHEALVRALRVGRIRGAALDATHPEPLPLGHPLLVLPNVVITPHIAGATRQTRDNIVQCAVQQLNNGLNGGEMFGEITKDYLGQLPGGQL